MSRFAGGFALVAPSGSSAAGPKPHPTSAVRVDDLELSVDLADGRTIAVPIAWFPRLAHGSEVERANWRVIGQGHGIHWPDLDEDISVESLLTGRRSRESDRSLKKWLENRNVH